MAWLLLVGCGPAGSSATDATDAASTATLDTPSTTHAEGDTDTADPFAAPDCAALALRGNAADVAATPRSNRDAEVLAASAVPDALVASEANYQRIVDDLAHMRADRPALEDMHADCLVPVGFSAWFDGSVDIVNAMSVGDYHAWDCHNAYYDTTQYRIDGIGYAVAFEGVYSAGILEAYRPLPGFETATLAPFFDAVDPYTDACEPPGGTVAVSATIDGAGVLAERTYVWTDAEGIVVQYAAAAGEAPVLQ